MSVAGLRFGSGRSSTAPLENKSGSYIYHRDAAHYHDWEFRTLLRIKLFDSKKDVEPSPTGRSSEPAGPDSEVEAGISPHPRPGHQDDGATASASPSPKGDDTGRDRSALVNKVVEGLRGDALLIARDLGLETLTQEGGLEHLAEQRRWWRVLTELTLPWHFPMDSEWNSCLNCQVRAGKRYWL